MIVVIKNFERNEASTLVAKSVKYFLPNIDIYLFNLYSEEINHYNLDKSLFKEIFDFKTKYLLGPGFSSPNNGFYYAEAYNLIYDKFKNYDDKLLILDENHYFTNGNTLKEITENDFDIAWAFFYWGGFGEYPNASIFCMKPNKITNFPLPEIKLEIEILLKEYLMDKNDVIKYQLKNRFHCDCFGDGRLTNDINIMKEDLKQILPNI